MLTPGTKVIDRVLTPGTKVIDRVLIPGTNVIDRVLPPDVTKVIDRALAPGTKTSALSFTFLSSNRNLLRHLVVGNKKRKHT